jgi:hypothetical protein
MNHPSRNGRSVGRLWRVNQEVSIGLGTVPSSVVCSTRLRPSVTDPLTGLWRGNDAAVSQSAHRFIPLRAPALLWVGESCRKGDPQTSFRRLTMSN